LLDQFNTVSWSNDDGTAAWSSDWIEFDDDGSATTGNVRVENGKLRLDSLDGGAKESVARSADLSAAATATLTFDYDAFGEGGLDIVAFEVSNDGGGTWTLLENLEIVGNISGSRSFTLDSYTALTGDMQIRFRIVQGLAGTTQHINFDNVQIAYSGTGVGGSSSVSSASASSSITVNPVDDSPVLDLDDDDSVGVGIDFSATFTEGAGPVDVVDVDGVISDVDSGTLAWLTATITNLQDGTDESLAADTSGTSIIASYDSATGVLTLSGSDSVANYQQVLRTVTYDNASANPGTADRLVAFEANDGSTSSNVGVTTLSIVPVNDPPSVTATGANLVYTENDGAVVVDVGLSVQDVDSANLTGATVEFLSGFAPAEDSLGFVDQLGISGSYDPGTGMLTLTGTTTVANYQTALRSVTYQNGSEDPELTDRVIRFQVSDGSLLASGSRTVSITPENDAPTAVADADTALEGGTISIDLAANDTDPDDALDPNSIVITSGPSNGSVIVNGDGTVDYTHDGSETIGDSFTYTIKDATGAVSNTATVTLTITPQDDNLTITPQDDNPVLGNNALTITEGGAVLLSGTELSATDAETASGLLTFTITGVTGGQFEEVANPGISITSFTQQQITDGEIQFVHDGGEVAPTYSVTVSDGALVDGPLAATITFTTTSIPPAKARRSRSTWPPTTSIPTTDSI
jgi:hypothetical protein